MLLDKLVHKVFREYKDLLVRLEPQEPRERQVRRAYRAFKGQRELRVRQEQREKLERRASKVFRGLWGQLEVLGQRELHPRLLVLQGLLELQVRQAHKGLLETLALLAQVEPLDTMAPSLVLPARPSPQ